MENIQQGLNLMVAGMGMVFAFLLIMVFVVNLSAKLLAPYKHLLEAKPAAKKPAPAPSPAAKSLSRSWITIPSHPRTTLPCLSRLSLKMKLILVLLAIFVKEHIWQKVYI